MLATGILTHMPKSLKHLGARVKSSKPQVKNESYTVDLEWLYFLEGFEKLSPYITLVGLIWETRITVGALDRMALNGITV